MSRHSGEDGHAEREETATGPQVAGNAMRDAGSVLLRRAQDAGEARPEIQMADVLRLIHGIVLANQAAPDPERLERMFDLVVAGLRA